MQTSQPIAARNLEIFKTEVQKTGDFMKNLEFHIEMNIQK